jgi:hypothetical protein
VQALAGVRVQAVGVDDELVLGARGDARVGEAIATPFRVISRRRAR